MVTVNAKIKNALVQSLSLLTAYKDVYEFEFQCRCSIVHFKPCMCIMLHVSSFLFLIFFFFFFLSVFGQEVLLVVSSIENRYRNDINAQKTCFTKLQLFASLIYIYILTCIFFFTIVKQLSFLILVT